MGGRLAPGELEYPVPRKSLHTSSTLLSDPAPFAAPLRKKSLFKAKQTHKNTKKVTQIREKKTSLNENPLRNTQIYFTQSTVLKLEYTQTKTEDRIIC